MQQYLCIFVKANYKLLFNNGLWNNSNKYNFIFCHVVHWHFKTQTSLCIHAVELYFVPIELSEPFLILWTSHIFMFCHVVNWNFKTQTSLCIHAVEFHFLSTELSEPFLIPWISHRLWCHQLKWWDQPRLCDSNTNEPPSSSPHYLNIHWYPFAL